MPCFDYTGVSKIVALLNAGLAVDDIVDAHGAALHPDARRFCASHATVKRRMIVKAHADPSLRNILAQLDPNGVPLPRRVSATRAAATTDFQHCVWLVPASRHPWHTYIRGVPAHLTVRAHLPSDAARTLGDAVRYEARHRSHLLCLRVHLQGNLRQTRSAHFYALEYDVVPDPACAAPSWWPAGAHVSFGYRYGRPFSRREMHAIERRLLYQRTAVLMHVMEARCTGHHAAWQYTVDDCDT